MCSPVLDPADHLTSDLAVANFMCTRIADERSGLCVVHAVGVVARANDMTEIARRTRLSWDLGATPSTMEIAKPDPAGYLASPEVQAELVAEAFESGDPKFIAYALGTVACTHGVTKMSKRR